MAPPYSALLSVRAHIKYSQSGHNTTASYERHLLWLLERAANVKLCHVRAALHVRNQEVYGDGPYCDNSCAGCQIMQGEQGVVAHVKLPHLSELSAYDKLELDFTLGCPGVHMPLWNPPAAPAVMQQLMLSAGSHDGPRTCKEGFHHVPAFCGKVVHTILLG